VRHEIMVWDVATAGQVAEFRAGGAPAPTRRGGLAFSPDGERLAFDEADWQTSKKPVDVAVFGATIAAAPPGPLGSPPLFALLAIPSGLQDRYTARPGRACVWEIASRRQACRLGLFTTRVNRLAFSADGRRVVGASERGGLAVWDAATGRLLTTLPSSEAYYDVACSPDGTRLAAVSRNLVTLWDTATGQEMLTLRGAPQRPSDNGFNPLIAFSPDGRRLAALNWDQSIAVWDAPEAAEATPQERRQEAEERAFAWHLRRARASQQAGQGFALAFHLERLEELTPPSERSAREVQELRIAQAKRLDPRD
jgi:WD40 repeat protein